MNPAEPIFLIFLIFLKLLPNFAFFYGQFLIDILLEFIFKQNQKARSRDSAVKFARNYLCTHAISGGFVQDGQKWYV